MLQQFPIYRTAHRLEQGIVRTLLEALREVEVEYPPYLLAACRSMFIAQLKSQPALESGSAGRNQNDNLRKAY